MICWFFDSMCGLWSTTTTLRLNKVNMHDCDGTVLWDNFAVHGFKLKEWFTIVGTTLFFLFTFCFSLFVFYILFISSFFLSLSLLNKKIRTYVSWCQRTKTIYASDLLCDVTVWQEIWDWRDSCREHLHSWGYPRGKTRAGRCRTSYCWG